LCLQTFNSADVFDAVSVLEEVELAIKKTQPTGPGQRNGCVFNLARYLRRVFPVETPHEVLLPIVQRWFGHAWTNITTRAFSVTWDDFLRAWGYPLLPYLGFLARVADSARVDDFELGNRITNQDLVARVFRAADVYSGGTAFYLGCRDIGRIAGMGHKAANKHSHGLVELGCLKCIELGKRGTSSRLASVWRWNGLGLETESESGCR
jgi:hypothetical protein